MKSTHSTRSMLRPTIVAAAAATLLAMGSGASFAADREQATARALAAIQAFPQRSFHGAGDSYELRDVIFDADGAEHVRFARRFHGLQVIGGDLVVHSDPNGAFVSASHTLTREAKVDRRARVTAGEAIGAASGRFTRHGVVGAPELVVYARGEHARLAWDVRLDGELADGTPSRLHVIVDAQAGGLLDVWDDIHTAPATAGAIEPVAKTGTGKTLFAGDVALATDRRFVQFGRYSMLDKTRGGQSTKDLNNGTSGTGTTFTDKDNTWGNNAVSDRATVGADAHYGITLTWDYYLQVHGRNGIANDGVGAYNRVHYGINYDNAFWDDNCFCMTYGDGSFFNPLVSIDVAGHEMTHGVTSRTAGLIYSGESGGLNEGTSDIFGTMVEYYANNANDAPDYLIGEEIYKTPGGFLRSMINPSSDGGSADCWYNGVGNLDVHYSSGVANHVFFLLAEGTTNGVPSKTCISGNTRVATGNGSVTGIGRAKAEKIWYRALTVYMVPNTNYAAARTATINAANDLFGAGTPEVNAVAAAWTAVNRP